MKLYHGTNVDFRQIDIAKSKAFKDFGQGFYLTDIRKQAEDWAKKNLNFLEVNRFSKNMISMKRSWLPRN